jgi:hypothetical protein
MKKLLIIAVLVPVALAARTLTITNDSGLVLDVRVKTSLRGSTGVKEHGSLHAENLKPTEKPEDKAVLDFANTSRVRRAGPAKDAHHSYKFAKVLDVNGKPVYDKLTDLFAFGTITKEVALKFKAHTADKTVKGRLKLNDLSKEEQTRFATASEVRITRTGDKLNFEVLKIAE